MEQLSIDFKNKVAAALISVIKDRSTIDEAFYKFYSISAANCLKLRLGRLENLMPDNQWLRLGRKLQVNQVDRQWNMARTDVFNTIEEDILFCKKYSKAKLCVDECGIGKTFTAKYLAATLPNCFYVDASQGKSITLFTRILAKAIGLDSGGKWYDVKEDIKCYLKMIPNPIVIIDEAGDLTQNTLQEVKELWN
uniref:ATP-binding protein n=1 Tax=Mucilaginibacter sp. TaxID=1882438 RepID=UPI0025E360EA